jgi:hypothetical protein
LAKFTLEVLDRVRERGLRDATALGCARKAALFAKCQEIANLMHFHDGLASIARHQIQPRRQVWDCNQQIDATMISPSLTDAELDPVPWTPPKIASAIGGARSIAW